jgi:hypothetical protein
MIDRRSLVASAAGLALPFPSIAMEPSPMTDPSQGLIDSLIAPGPHPLLGAEADTYGRLIGSWAGRFHDSTQAGVVTGPMEVHFAWALQGRAVQDTWIAPSRAARPGAEPLPVEGRDTYGSTLRVWDPLARLWRVTWTSPARQIVQKLVGHRVGDDIVQWGFWNDRPQRWCFRGITPGSYAWEAHGLGDDGVSWDLQTRFELERTA